MEEKKEKKEGKFSKTITEAIAFATAIVLIFFAFNFVIELIAVGPVKEIKWSMGNQHKKLSQDLVTLEMKDFRRATKLIKKMEGVDSFYLNPDSLDVSINYLILEEEGIYASSESVDCRTWSAPDNEVVWNFCEKRGLEVRKKLREKIPALKDRPL